MTFCHGSYMFASSDHVDPSTMNRVAPSHSVSQWWDGSVRSDPDQIFCPLYYSW